ncbi:MAG: penicillin acylase family protein, partial [Myxococcales bacterium]
ENPPDGVVVTANNRIAPAAYPHYLSDLYEPPYRAKRIRQLLAEKEHHGIDDMVSIQLDVRSEWAKRLVAGILAPLRESGIPLTTPAREALDALLSWDGEATPDSMPASIYYGFYLQLIGRLLKTLLGEDLFHGYFELLNASVVPVENLLLSAESSFHGAKERNELAARALEDAVYELRRRFGEEPDRWRWGSQHALHLRHRLHELKPLRFVLSPGPFETGGDGTTVNNGQFYFSNPFGHVLGAAYRQIFDLADWDTGRVVLAGGQSGNPLSPRYKDHVERWLNGAYFPLPFSRGAVERAKVGDAVTLSPAAP